MCDRTKVSIIMPVYNAERELEYSVHSALTQSLDDIELICVDDGSTDNSLSILRALSQKDPRLIVLSQNNQGSGPARNLAMAHARGKYVVFLDSDDFYPSDKTLEHLFSKIEEQGVAICGGSFSRYYQRQIHTDFPTDLKPYIFSQEGLIQYKDYQFDYGYHRFIYSLSFIRNQGICFPELKRFQDVPFFVQAMIAAKAFYAIPEITYCYRKNFNRSKPADWTSEKYRDVLKGITMNLKLSREAGLSRLHARTWMHFCQPDYREALELAINRRNYETISLIEPLFQEVNVKWLEEANLNPTADISSIRGRIQRCFQEREKLLLPRRVSREPKVSIIMPSLNVEPYIRLCIESVLRQTLSEIEIICVDAGSTDGTLEILQQYAAIDERIKILNSKKKSYGYQVNMGIKAANAPYITIVETDDYIAPNMYSELYQEMKDQDLDVVKGDYYVFLGDGKAEKTGYHHITTTSAYNRILSGNDLARMIPDQLFSGIYIWAGLYKTAFLRENAIVCQETPGASFQDNGFWYTLLMHARRMKFIRKPYYHLRRDNPNSSVMSSGKIHCMKDEYDFIRIRIDYLQDGPDKQLFIHLCSYYRFKNYMMTYNRINESERPSFLRDMAQEFRCLEAVGELDYHLFSHDELNQITEIMDDASEYYVTDIARLRKSILPQPKVTSKNLRNPVNRILSKAIVKMGYGLIYWGENGLAATLIRLTKTVKNIITRGAR